jgi:hypothetical protein
MKDLKQKDYNSVLLETSDFFKSQGINIIGEGYKEIATNQQLFESYVESLLEGVGADNQAVLGQLMANTNAGILRESSLSGIAPIASLSMPVIRKLWPKFALKEALKTEVAKTPRFVVSYMKPYMFRGDNEKVFLPKGLATNASAVGLGSVKDTYATATVTTVAGGTVNVDFGVASGTGFTVASHELISGEGNTGEGIAAVASGTKRQPLDSEIRVTSLAVTFTKAAGADPLTYYVKLPTHKIDVTGSIFLDLTSLYENAGADLFTDAALVTPFTTGNPAVQARLRGQILVRTDLSRGTALVATISLTGTNLLATYLATPSVVVATVKAGVSTEFNERGWSVGFDVGRMDIDIPTGQHINAPLPIEALNDMMALYQIDGTKETVDLMTNVFAQRLDIEVLEFLDRSFINQPGVAEFSNYPDAGDYMLTFDVRPAAGFAGSPKAWREELKPQIDFLSQKIKNQTYFQSGIFTIVGNPLDIQLLTNIDWQFRGGQGAGMDGVDVDYSVGTYVGANAYRVIASVNVPQGQLYLVFTPNSDTQMTYKYFPYTFSTEMGYIDPNRSRVPSIMMTKRHSFAEFLPALGMINIVNNTGTGQFTTGYWPNQGSWGTPGTGD